MIVYAFYHKRFFLLMLELELTLRFGIDFWEFTHVG